jgi:hypothetical protein
MECPVEVGTGPSGLFKVLPELPRVTPVLVMLHLVHFHRLWKAAGLSVEFKPGSQQARIGVRWAPVRSKEKRTHNHHSGLCSNFGAPKCRDKLNSQYKLFFWSKQVFAGPGDLLILLWSKVWMQLV